MTLPRTVSRVWNGLRWYASAAQFLRWRASGPLHIVTGADSSHFSVMVDLLESINRFEPSASTAIWDLGLTPRERSIVLSQFPDTELHTFDFSAHPGFFDIRKAAGAYAWKPTLFAREVAQQSRITLWLDAGDRLTGPLTWIRRFVRAQGFYSVFSDGTVRTWTHPTALQEMRVEQHLLDLPNLASGLVAVDPGVTEARSLIEAWAELAFNENAFAPAGSSKANHRQDQSVLTVLAHRAGLFDARAFHLRTPPVHVLFHQDPA